jgi:micrococcal nuclease
MRGPDERNSGGCLGWVRKRWCIISRAFGLKHCWLTLLLALSVAVVPGLSWGGPVPSSGKVVFVCDGDTVILESGERIRYLGIDAPEIAHDKVGADCFGNEAGKLNSDLVLHKQVTLQYDREVTDPHGRLLAYVVLPDGRCANVEMLRAGCAFVFRSATGFRRLEEFLALQRDAIHKRKGLWGACPVKPAKAYLGNRRSFVFHRPECFLGKKTAARERTTFIDRWEGLEQGYRPCRYCKP